MFLQSWPFVNNVITIHDLCCRYGHTWEDRNGMKMNSLRTWWRNTRKLQRGERFWVPSSRSSQAKWERWPTRVGRTTKGEDAVLFKMTSQSGSCPLRLRSSAFCSISSSSRFRRIHDKMVFRIVAQTTDELVRKSSEKVHDYSCMKDETIQALYIFNSFNFTTLQKRTPCPTILCPDHLLLAKTWPRLPRRLFVHLCISNLPTNGNVDLICNA